MRVTVPSVLFVTQTDPAPAAIPVGSFPTSTNAVRRPERGFTRVTYPLGSVTQIESNAASVGLGVDAAYEQQPGPSVATWSVEASRS